MRLLPIALLVPTLAAAPGAAAPPHPLLPEMQAFEASRLEAARTGDEATLAQLYDPEFSGRYDDSGVDRAALFERFRRARTAGVTTTSRVSDVLQMHANVRVSGHQTHVDPAAPDYRRLCYFEYWIHRIAAGDWQIFHGTSFLAPAPPPPSNPANRRRAPQGAC